MSIVALKMKALRIWRDRTVFRATLARLHSKHLVIDLGYSPEMADVEIGRWFFQPLLIEEDEASTECRLSHEPLLRDRRFKDGLPPILFPARA